MTLVQAKGIHLSEIDVINLEIQCFPPSFKKSVTAQYMIILSTCKTESD